MNKAHENLLKFFTISCAAFDFQKAIMIAFGKNPHLGPMEELHRRCLDELQKPEPNLFFVDTLLDMMEKQAETNKKFHDEIHKANQ